VTVPGLLEVPSEYIIASVHSDDIEERLAGRARIEPPQGMRSLIVLARPLEHPEEDSWGPQGSPADLALAAEGERIARRLRDAGFPSRLLPYGLRHGGIPLKDAAACAGLGRIGKNNLLLTPSRGPRVRLRALWTVAELESAPFQEDDPCEGCSAPCVHACPRGAFDAGRFDRSACYDQMDDDVKRGEGRGLVYYCRACELACSFCHSGT